jgi:Stress responsive A/B Barrel Domain
MRIALLMIAVTLPVAFFMTISAQSDAGAADNKPPVLRHIVLYKFKDDLKPVEVQEIVDAFAALPKKIDGIVAFEHGTNVSPEGKSEGLTHAFVVSFRDEKARDAYLAHPAHQEYVKLVRDRREKVVVFDYWGHG